MKNLVIITIVLLAITLSTTSFAEYGTKLVLDNPDHQGKIVRIAVSHETGEISLSPKNVPGGTPESPIQKTFYRDNFSKEMNINILFDEMTMVKIEWLDGWSEILCRGIYINRNHIRTFDDNWKRNSETTRLTKKNSPVILTLPENTHFKVSWFNPLDKETYYKQ